MYKDHVDGDKAHEHMQDFISMQNSISSSSGGPQDKKFCLTVSCFLTLFSTYPSFY